MSLETSRLQTSKRGSALRLLNVNLLWEHNGLPEHSDYTPFKSRRLTEGGIVDPTVYTVPSHGDRELGVE